MRAKAAEGDSEGQEALVLEICGKRKKVLSDIFADGIGNGGNRIGQPNDGTRQHLHVILFGRRKAFLVCLLEKRDAFVLRVVAKGLQEQLCPGIQGGDQLSIGRLIRLLVEHLGHVLQKIVYNLHFYSSIFSISKGG